jgi:hypothetical protein
MNDEQRHIVMSDTPIFEEVVARWLSEGRQVPGRGPAMERVVRPEPQRKAAS